MSFILHILEDLTLDILYKSLAQHLLYCRCSIFSASFSLPGDDCQFVILSICITSFSYNSSSSWRKLYSFNIICQRKAVFRKMPLSSTLRTHTLSFPLFWEKDWFVKIIKIKHKNKLKFLMIYLLWMLKVNLNIKKIIYILN